MPPAICLMVMAGIAIVWTLFSTLVQGAGTEEYITLLEGMANDQNRELIDGMIQAMSGEGSVLIMILSTGLTMLFSCLIALGGFKMMRLESWGLALAGSIAAVIPCFSPCCCLTIPFGVWALVILNDPRIKAAFH